MAAASGGTDARVPPLLWSVPGAGNTFVRWLFEAASGVASGSIYHDRSLARGGFRAEMQSLRGSNCSSLSVIKAHDWTVKEARATCAGLISLVIFLVRHPLASIWADYQLECSGRHDHAMSLSELRAGGTSACPRFAEFAETRAAQIHRLFLPMTLEAIRPLMDATAWSAIPNQFPTKLFGPLSFSYSDWRGGAPCPLQLHEASSSPAPATGTDKALNKAPRPRRSMWLRYEDLLNRSTRTHELGRALRFARLPASQRDLQLAFERKVGGGFTRNRTLQVDDVLGELTDD